MIENGKIHSGMKNKGIEKYYNIIMITHYNHNQYLALIFCLLIIRLNLKISNISYTFIIFIIIFF